MAVWGRELDTGDHKDPFSRGSFRRAAYIPDAVVVGDADHLEPFLQGGLDDSAAESYPDRSHRMSRRDRMSEGAGPPCGTPRPAL